ncbi:hypothetical protein Pan216_15570 [Planctomycetes bacterium Pan216]|uniref:Uncharacterized protein n=1 Tax=Kolteria novifilia TaxID=2527975 RepID=A0A518B152_9BACT|nr:hypothetical protein Pan216_15570 [Planctomycetes bacterium Pan216]
MGVSRMPTASVGMTTKSLLGNELTNQDTKRLLGDEFTHKDTSCSPCSAHSVPAGEATRKPR